MDLLPIPGCSCHFDKVLRHGLFERGNSALVRTLLLHLDLSPLHPLIYDWRCYRTNPFAKAIYHSANRLTQSRKILYLKHTYTLSFTLTILNTYITLLA